MVKVLKIYINSIFNAKKKGGFFMRKLLVTMLMCLIVLAGCGAKEKEAGEVDASTQQTEIKDLKFAVVIHDTGNVFFTDLKAAAESAGEKLGVQIDFMGPSSVDVAEQVNMIETCIEGGYDGIAYSAPDPDSFKKVYDKAAAAGIPMLTFNSDANENSRIAFIGQDHVNAGYNQAKWLFEKMNGEGKVIIATCEPGMLALEQRIEGVTTAAQEYPGIEIISTIDITGDLSTAYGVIENALTANPDVNAFIGVDVYSEAIGTVIEKKGLNGQVLGAGFDLIDANLQHIKNGSMQMIVGQNPYLQGFYPIVELYLNAAQGTAFHDIDTGLEIVSEENIDLYLK